MAFYKTMNNFSFQQRNTRDIESCRHPVHSLPRYQIDVVNFPHRQIWIQVQLQLRPDGAGNP